MNPVDVVLSIFPVDVVLSMFPANVGLSMFHVDTVMLMLFCWRYPVVTSF
jgi:hypothetical protein